VRVARPTSRISETPFGTHQVDERLLVGGVTIEVHDVGDVRDRGPGRTHQPEVQGLAEQVRHRVGAALTHRAVIVGALIALDFGVDRFLMDFGGFGVVERVHVQHVVDAARPVIPASLVPLFFGLRTAVTVDRVSDPTYHGT